MKVEAKTFGLKGNDGFTFFVFPTIIVCKQKNIAVGLNPAGYTNSIGIHWMRFAITLKSIDD